jgi:predicted phosphoadenosine phosphosulfate sulfurtransferase
MQETNINVYDAAKQRIKEQILFFDDFYVSFSGGKDSGVLANLVVEVAKELDRLPVKMVFSDLEVIFQETARYTKAIFDLSEVKPYWLCLEEIEDNASSVYERYYKTWDSKKKEKWVREMPAMSYVINNDNCPGELKKYFNGNINEWTIMYFGEYLCDTNSLKNICNFIGMRSEESYGRHMAVAAAKNRVKRNEYTYLTKNGCDRTWTSLPIYDWSLGDIWHYYASNEKDYNRVYDSMYRMGLSLSEMRTCFAFGEAQKKTLWQWQVIEPETWEKMCDRVQGANFGKMYNHTNLNRNTISKPVNVSWKEYLSILLNSLPPLIKANFEDKFNIAFRYHKVMYEYKENISPDVYIQDSRRNAKEKSKETGLGIKYFISYETLCWAILKRDFVFERYGFGYSEKMNNRIKEYQSED